MALRKGDFYLGKLATSLASGIWQGVTGQDTDLEEQHVCP